MNNDPLLVEVKDIKTYFFLDEGTIRALDGISFDIYRGKVLGVVGESGCGKSVTARSIMRIVPPPGQITEGQVLYHREVSNGGGQATEVVDLTALGGQSREMRGIRGSEISMIFQEPMTSLSPVHTIGNQIIETITLHQNLSKQAARELAIETLNHVGMPQPSRTIDRYPHELSGGMRQRAMIAMALACNPSLLIADEPTTALDVTTSAQILTLMRRLQDELGMAIMFITHDLGVIAQMTERVVVMYLGKIVEEANVDTLFHNPKHPYTIALLESIPRLGQKTRERKRLASIKGSVPDPYSIPKGCPYHTRCSEFMPGVCDQEDPPLIQFEEGHSARCHLYV